MTRGEVWWADLEQPIGTRPVLIITHSLGGSPGTQSTRRGSDHSDGTRTRQRSPSHHRRRYAEELRHQLRCDSHRPEKSLPQSHHHALSDEIGRSRTSSEICPRTPLSHLELSTVMTQAQILTEFQQLTTPQQLDLLQAALDVVRKSFSQSQPNSLTASQASLSDAAQRLLADYETDSELTCFTSLDGEPIHAAW